MLNKEQLNLLLQLVSSPQLAIPALAARCFVSTIDELQAQKIEIDKSAVDETKEN